MKVLVALDGSGASLRAVRWVAQTFPSDSTEVIAASIFSLDLNVYVAGYIPPAGWPEQMSAELKASLEGEWTAELRDRGFHVECHVREGYAERKLLELVTERCVDMMVVG